MSDDRSFHVLEAVPHRLEVGPAQTRRRWSMRAKMALIEETLKPGANVSAIARQAGIAPAQLFGWRRKALETGVVRRDEPEPQLGFVEVTSPSFATIEIVLAGNNGSCRRGRRSGSPGRNPEIIGTGDES